MGDNQNNNKTSVFTLIFTIIAWIVVSLLTLWPVLSIIWYLSSKYWLTELYIPYSVRVTVEKIKIIILWALLVGTIFIIHKAFKLKKLRSIYGNSLYVKTPKSSAELEWVEMSYTKQESEYMNHLNKLIKYPVDTDFSKLLSYGVILFNKKRYIGAADIYRFIIWSDDAPMIIKKIAEYRLLQALPHLNQGGMSISSKFSGGNVYEKDKP